MKRTEGSGPDFSSLEHYICKEAFPALAGTLSQFLNCQRIVLLMFDEELMAFRIINLISEPPVPELSDSISFSVRDTIISEPILAGEIHTPRSWKNSFLPGGKGALKTGYRSRIALPLRSEGKTIGALVLLSTRPEPFWESKVPYSRR
ncbi:MAG: GAF domain-containing protein [Anaerolineae bacterium]|nr:GAF domain-containing protein [Anaerolineae bacterium]